MFFFRAVIYLLLTMKLLNFGGRSGKIEIFGNETSGTESLTGNDYVGNFWSEPFPFFCNLKLSGTQCHICGRDWPG